MAKKKRNRRRRSQLPAVCLLLFVTCTLALGVWMIAQRLTPQPVPSPGEPEIVAVITEPTTEPPTLPPTTVPETTEAPTEPPTLPPGTVTALELSFYRAVVSVGEPSIRPMVFLTPEDAPNSALLWESSDPSVAVCDSEGSIVALREGECDMRAVSMSNPDVTAQVHVTVEPPENAQLYPVISTPDSTAYTEPPEGFRDDIQVIHGITYVRGVMLVNKTYPLPADYAPGGLIPEAAEAFAALRQAASEEAGLYLFSHSDYRSHQSQQSIYANYVYRDGQAAADRFSARAGYSEHQTGMVIDVNFPGDAFNDTPEAQWLEENCTRFGFIIRFPRDKEAYTGYKYESWHIRYVGKEWAEAITNSGLCLEEYFHVHSEYPEADG